MKKETMKTDRTMVVQDTALYRLQQEEEIVQRGLDSFMKAGEALARIKNQKLYKDQYRTYEEYCRQRWGFTPQYANRLIAASKLIGNMIESDTTVSVLPQNERQTRVLAKAADPSEVWKEAQGSTGKEQPTAKEIESVIKKDRDNGDDVIDAVIEESENTSTRSTQNIILNLSKEELTKPYKYGIITGRKQINVDVDDETRERYNMLTERLSMPNYSVVANALKLMELYVNTIERETKNAAFIRNGTQK